MSSDPIALFDFDDVKLPTRRFNPVYLIAELNTDFGYSVYTVYSNSAAPSAALRCELFFPPVFYAESSAAVHVGFGAYWLLLALVVSSWVSVGFLSFSLLLVCGARKPCTFILPAMSAATIFFVGANPKKKEV